MLKYAYAQIARRQKNGQRNFSREPFLEAPPRFELGNQGFADPCLTTWLWRHACPKNVFDGGKIKKQRGNLFGAGNEIRTRDIHLGKVTLYH